MIMNSLLNKLPLLAFVLAAFAAVAFTSPKEEANMERWAIINGVFVDVTDEVIAGDYRCDETTQQIHCLYDGDNGNPVSPLETKYVPQ